MALKIAVSGTIGVGKSTFSKFLADRLEMSLFEEPVAENPYLDDYYADPSRVAFNMQVFLLMHRYQRHIECDAVLGSGISSRGFVLDRCFDEDRVFADVNLAVGNMTQRDYDTYRHVYDTVRPFVSAPDVVVYLHCPPQVAMDRIASRGRESERAITLDYLQTLDRAYDVWFDGMRAVSRDVIRVDWSPFGDMVALADDVASRVF